MSRDRISWQLEDAIGSPVSPIHVAVWLVESAESQWAMSVLTGDKVKILLSYFRYELPIHVIADRFHQPQAAVRRELADVLGVLESAARTALRQPDSRIGHIASRWRERRGEDFALDWVRPCASCGDSLILWAPFGRPRRTCTDLCRARAYRAAMTGAAATPPLPRGSWGEFRYPVAPSVLIDGDWHMMDRLAYPRWGIGL